jgi:hypothetical protein
MIIQRVIRGMAGISQTQAQTMLDEGILCNLIRNKGPMSFLDIPRVLVDRNADWHQDHYGDPDPLHTTPPNEIFSLHTPFISTTAGTVERRKGKNVTWTAFDVALRFATAGFKQDGYLFYCDLFVIGRSAVPVQAFSEELRELNVNPRYSVYQVEGEILAKLVIPPAQIERADFFDLQDVKNALALGQLPTPDPTRSLSNPLYFSSTRYSNLRDVLS